MKKFFKIDNDVITHIKFKCTQCGNCCKLIDELLITLSPADLFRISKHVNLKPEEFMVEYCDWINDDLLSLKPKNGYCIFFDPRKKLCKIHEVKPGQCSSFPFWKMILFSVEHPEWKRYKQICSGFNGDNKWVKIQEDKSWDLTNSICKN